ncbi:MAG TPA: hexose kinase [Candidatus Limnocylindrales bacterium]|nr:hexose kinase [Candidatus Limnocylindrales bacterium]
MSRLVCVAPNPSIDRLYVVDRLLPGAIHRPTLSVAVPGGKGLNAARAAHTLGADVVTVTILRGHAGQWIEDQLAQLGVRSRVAWASGETRTCISIRDPETEGLTEIYDRGEPLTPSDWAGLEELVAQELAAGAELLTISGGVPPGIDDDAFGRICRVARRSGAKALIDVYGPGLIGALHEQPWLVKVNAAESAELLGRPVEAERDAVEAAAEIRRRGADVAIVTMGRSGAVASMPDGELRLPPPAMIGPYGVGSGDAFLGGLAAGLLAGQSLPEALQLASAAATAAAQKPGPGNLDVDLARRLFGASSS